MIARDGSHVSIPVTISDGQREADVLIDSDSSATIADLASAAAALLGGYSSRGSVRVGGRELTGDLALAFAGLRPADLVEVTVSDPPVELVDVTLVAREPPVRLKGGRLTITPDAPAHGDEPIRLRGRGAPAASAPVRAAARRALPADDGRVAVPRPPRVVPPAPRPRFDVPVPPDQPRSAHLPLGYAVVPLVAGVVMALVTHSKAMLIFAAFTPLMAMTSYLTDRRSGRSTFRQAYQRFVADVTALDERLRDALAAEVAHRHRSAPDVRAVVAQARERRSSLWERRPGHADFLELRLGCADLDSGIEVVASEQGDEDLRAWAGEVTERYRTAVGVPLTAPLRRFRGIGLHGEPAEVARIAFALVAQLAAQHSPSEVVLGAALSPRASDEWSWIKWLPHTREQALPGEGAILTVGRAAGQEMLERVRMLGAARRGAARARQRPPTTAPPWCCSSTSTSA